MALLIAIYDRLPDGSLSVYTYNQHDSTPKAAGQPVNPAGLLLLFLQNLRHCNKMGIVFIEVCAVWKDR